MCGLIVEVRVDPNREVEARSMLREANGRATAERIQRHGPPPGAPVTLTSIDAYEVIAQA